MDCIGLGPSSIKTREVLGNPSLMPKRFPETRKISRGRSPREILRVEGNLEGRGDGFPNNSRVLVEDGHSLLINFSTGSGSRNPSLLMMMRECELREKVIVINFVKNNLFKCDNYCI